MVKFLESADPLPILGKHKDQGAPDMQKGSSGVRSGGNRSVGSSVGGGFPIQ